MFIVNTEIMVNYFLNNSSEIFLYTDFDVRVIEPNGNFNFYGSAILESDYFAPTLTTSGAVSYAFTPTYPGVWVVALIKGVEPDYDIYNEYTLRAIQPETSVKQQVVLG
jgi:hypothetical protein